MASSQRTFSWGKQAKINKELGLFAQTEAKTPTAIIAPNDSQLDQEDELLAFTFDPHAKPKISSEDLDAKVKMAKSLPVKLTAISEEKEKQSANPDEIDAADISVDSELINVSVSSPINIPRR